MKGHNMNLTIVSVGPLVALIAGVLILIMPSPPLAHLCRLPLLLHGFFDPLDTQKNWLK